VTGVNLVRLACEGYGPRAARTTLGVMESDRGGTRAAHDAGERLRILLQRASLTPEQLATRLNQLARQLGLSARIDRKTPYKWLRGSIPREPWPALISTILSRKLDVKLAVTDIGWRLAKSGLNFVPANNGLAGAPWDHAGTIGAVIDVAEQDMTDRRVFLQLTGTALTQPAFEWLIARPAPDASGGVGRRVLDAHVDSIEEITAQLRRMDDQFGGGAVLDPVKSQVRFVLDLLRNRRYTSSVGSRLYGAAAELLRLAGYVSFDSSDHAAAQRFWIAGLHAAHSGGDRTVGANILGFMGIQAGELDQPGEAVRLAESAMQGYRGRDERVTAILSFRAARAYARVNDVTSCERAIDAGYSAFQDAGVGGPGWAYWLNEAEIYMQAGYCYTVLEDWARAGEHLSAAIRLRDDSFRRVRVMRLALLAGVHAGQGEPEQACATAGQAIDLLADDVDSDRCVGEVRRVFDALAPYRRVPAVRELAERIGHSFGAV
jgi:transcriptional regulator with XRE-family HTH domain